MSREEKEFMVVGFFILAAFGLTSYYVNTKKNANGREPEILVKDGLLPRFGIPKVLEN